jgi:tetratricopeptide (TPR) repeat protein
MALRGRGIVYTLLDHAELARQDFEDLLAVDPTDSTAISQLPRILYILEEYELALKAYEQRAGLEELTPEEQLWRASCLLEINRFEEGRNVLEQVFGALSGDPFAWSIRAELTMLTGDHSLAQEYASRAIELEEAAGAHLEDWDLYIRGLAAVLQSGTTRAGFEDFDRALAVNAKADRLGDNRWRCDFNRALYTLAQGNVDEAARLYRTVLEAEPDLHSIVGARRGLANQLERLKRKEAEQILHDMDRHLDHLRRSSDEVQE